MRVKEVILMCKNKGITQPTEFYTAHGEGAFEFEPGTIRAVRGMTVADCLEKNVESYQIMNSAEYDEKILAFSKIKTADLGWKAEDKVLCVLLA